MDNQIVIVYIFPEPEEDVSMAALIDMCRQPFKDIPGVSVKMARGDAAETVKFFLDNGELPTQERPPDGSLGRGKFKKKPVEIEAIQLRWSTRDQIEEFLGHNPEFFSIRADEASDTCDEVAHQYLAIKVTTTHGDEAVVRHGDWIIPDSKPGTFYPCKPDVFSNTYNHIVEVS